MVAVADLTVVDECEVARSKEAIRDNYILLTNSRAADEETAGAILNVSSTHQMSQVGINSEEIFYCKNLKISYSVREW